MKENIEKITVKLNYDPNKDDAIVEISPNATVSELEEKVKDTLGELNNVPMGILKYDGKELNDKDKTLEELGITDDAVLEVGCFVRFTAINKNEFYYVQYNKDTTLEQFLWSVIKHLKLNEEINEENGKYVSLICKDQFLSPELLDSKLIDITVDRFINQEILSENIDASTITLAFPYDTKNKSLSFDLNSLTGKNIDISGIRITEIPNERKPIPNKDGIDLKIDYVSQTFSSEKILNKRNCPLLRMIIGIIDLILLAAAVATFLLYFLTTLSLSVAVPIVLAALFVVGAINTILPKILPEGCL